MNIIANITTKFIAPLLLLISCGGPGVVVNEGEYTKKLPETTKAVEKLQPLIKKIETEQEMERTAKATIEEAGQVEPLAKERSLKVLSTRSNFLTASQFSRQSDESLCDLKELIAYEELIDSAKLISLAESFKQCPTPQALQVISKDSKTTVLLINIPSFWISSRMEIDPQLEIHSTGHPLSIVTQYLDLNTSVSTTPTPSSTNHLAGHFRIATLVTKVGSQASVNVTSRPPPAVSFDSLSPTRKREIVQSAFEAQQPATSIPINSVAPPHDLKEMQAQLMSQTVDRIIYNLQNIKPSDFKDVAQYKFAKAQVSSQIRRALDWKLPAKTFWHPFKNGTAQWYLFDRYFSSTSQVKSRTFQANFHLARSGVAPLPDSVLNLIPQRVSIDPEEAAALPSLEWITLESLEPKIPVIQNDPARFATLEFAPFPAGQYGKAKVITTALLSLGITRSYRRSDDWVVAGDLLASPETLSVQEEWSVTIESTPQPQAPSSSLETKVTYVEPVQAVQSVDELVDRLKSWELPPEIADTAVVQKFLVLARGHTK